MSLTLKFSLFMATLVFATLSTVTIALAWLRIQQIEDELGDKSLISSELLAKEFSDSFADYYFYQYDTYRDFVKRKMDKNEDVVHFVMYSASGEVLFDTEYLGDPQGSRPREVKKVVDQSLLDTITSKQQRQKIEMHNGVREIQVFQPYIDKFDVYRNMFEFHYSTKAVQEAIKDTVIFYALFLTLFTALSVGTTVILVNQITKPVKTLTNAALKFASGVIDYPLESESKDEIGTLARAFKQMAIDLSLSRSKLQEQNQNLEQEVEKRTKELREQLIEMERLQKLTVDRELKMVEMKKQVQELQEKAS